MSDRREIVLPCGNPDCRDVRVKINRLEQDLKDADADFADLDRYVDEEIVAAHEKFAEFETRNQQLKDSNALLEQQVARMTQEVEMAQAEATKRRDAAETRHNEFKSLKKHSETMERLAKDVIAFTQAHFDIETIKARTKADIARKQVKDAELELLMLERKFDQFKIYADDRQRDDSGRILMETLATDAKDARQRLRVGKKEEGKPKVPIPTTLVTRSKEVSATHSPLPKLKRSLSEEGIGPMEEGPPLKRTTQGTGVSSSSRPFSNR